MTVTDRALLDELFETGSFPAETSLEDVTEVFKSLGQAESTLRWGIGDALIAAERLFGDAVYQAAEATGLAKSTLQKYRWVAEHIEPVRRREHLSFTHHEVVASLPWEEADLWLYEAQRLGWSVEELRGHVRPDKPVLECTCVTDPECPKHGDH